MLLLGVVVTVLGLHELFRMTRPLRPTPLTGHLGGIALLVVAYEWRTLLDAGRVSAACSWRRSWWRPRSRPASPRS